METDKEWLGAPVNYVEYLQTPVGERWEIIDGVPFAMSPAPQTEHQRIVGRLFVEFSVYLRGKNCEAFVAPFDVLLFADKDSSDDKVDTVVQPDIVVICDKNKIDRRGCVGSPDLIVEVLSESTAKRDREDKFRLYRRAKVKEYWIVDPLNKYIEVIYFHNDQESEHLKFPERKVFSSNDQVTVGVVPELSITLADIFS